ncbi:MAG TPA: hypothetical protein PKY70_16455 [Nakamurella multipartita]|nr:hypothetical protein [Nakamurella multipartita]
MTGIEEGERLRRWRLLVGDDPAAEPGATVRVKLESSTAKRVMPLPVQATTIFPSESSAASA